MSKECLDKCPIYLAALDALSRQIPIPSMDGLLGSPLYSGLELQEFERASRMVAACVSGPTTNQGGELICSSVQKTLTTFSESAATSPVSPAETPVRQAPGFAQTILEVVREYPFGFYSALLDLVLGRGEFADKK